MKELSYQDFIYSYDLTLLWCELIRMKDKVSSDKQKEKVSWMLKRIDNALEIANRCEEMIADQSHAIIKQDIRINELKQVLKYVLENYNHDEDIKKRAYKYFKLK